MVREKTIEERYQKKTQLEHILLRPDTYVGSLDVENAQCWVWSDEEQRMVNKSIKFVPAMFKIFDEILVNAADVKAREQHETGARGSQKMTRLEVTINSETGMITVLNDGPGIPVEIHKEHKVYIAEMIFGHLLTSDNYDDNEARVTGGRNGFGAKLTNIFSSFFEVEVIDSKRKRLFRMTWRDNMSTHSEPEIMETSLKSDYVKVKFIPDLKRFNVTELDADLLSLLKKRVFDIAGTTGVRVMLNGVKLPVRDFKSYVDLYFHKPLDSSSTTPGMLDGSQPASGGNIVSSDSDFDDRSVGESPSSSSGEKKRGGKRGKKGADDDEIENHNLDTNGGRVRDYFRVHEKVNERWEVIVTQSDGQFQQVSFVNSICTTKGGTHVNYVVEPMIQAILKKVSSKNKGGIEIKGFNVRTQIFVFLNCLVVNPTFDSQTKETLTLKHQAFGSTCVVSDRTINAVVKSPITDAVLLWAQTKQEIDLRRKMKASGSGRQDRILGIPKLEDANDAGSRHAASCTLILTEGDSAKTSCVAGLSVVGKDRYGVFPLRGKVLNVRDATFKQLMENKEIRNILRITGLEVGKTFTPKDLRYGSIMIMTDQDHDGSHIKGLLINLFQHYWPDLLKIDGFLKEFVTPIVKVSKAQSELAFLTLTEYETWKEANNGAKGWKVKYYKGLGTSSDKEFKEYFKALNSHQLNFKYEDEKDFEAIDMAFNSKRAEDRKTWIQSFEEGTFLDHREHTVSYKDFVNKELILFSKYDTERSIPSVMDGWKPGQRKVLFGVFKKGLVKKEMKVAQLASFVAEQSAYHHGEESLAATIVNMAQTFVGSNNLNILEPCGQFGSRKEGGKDASATRYIYTKLTDVARAIFSQNDEPILHYNNEEGRIIEPKWYVPVIPLVMVNGAEGIGTGWSSSVPNFNPRDIIRNLRKFIAGESMESMAPWYRGFRGRIERNSKNTGFESVGIIEKVDDETLFVSELPIRQWTQPYKEFLEELMTFTREEEAAASGRGKAKAKASAGAGRGSRSGDGPPARKHPPPVTIHDFRDNCTHESIAFTIKIDPCQLGIMEQEDLERVFRLRKSLPTTNMTLFGPDGKVNRYETDLDILREFATVRLDFYHKRKRHRLNVLAEEKCLISNKLKFIVMVVEGKLIIQKKKKDSLVDELREHGFDSLHRIQTMYNTKNPTMEGDLDEDGTVREVEETLDENHETVTDSSRDFDYLLGLPLWSLTYERVEDLRKSYQQKEKEFQDYEKKTPEQLWFEDLDNLEIAIDEHEAKFAAELKKDELSRAKGIHVFATKVKGAPKPRALKTSKKDEGSTVSTEKSKATVNNSQVLKRLREKMTVDKKTDKTKTLDNLFNKLQTGAVENPDTEGSSSRKIKRKLEENVTQATLKKTKQTSPKSGSPKQKAKPKGRSNVVDSDSESDELFAELSDGSE